MSVDVSGLRVIVTAGAGGIGRAIAATFHQNGAKVHTCDVAADALDAVAQELPGLGTTVVDVADPKQVDRLFDEAEAWLGGLDVLVNNAGIAGPTGPVEQMDIAAWDRTIAVNISSQFYCVRRAVPLLKAAGGGLIANLASVAGLFGYPLRSPYAASKWAVVGYSKTLAMDLGDANIRVNAIAPGFFHSRLADAAIPLAEPGIKADSPIPRVGDAGELKGVAVFLAADASNYITGQVVVVDGGRTIT